jgi:hypothetical protein
MSNSAISLPLVQFKKGLCSVCGVEQVPGDALKQQGCSGNTAKSWSVYPLCEACAAHIFKAISVCKTKAQSKRSARAKKRARPATAARYNRSVSASERDTAEAQKFFCITARVAAHARVGQVASRLCSCYCRAVVARAHVDKIEARCGVDGTLPRQTIIHAQLW